MQERMQRRRERFESLVIGIALLVIIYGGWIFIAANK